MSDKTTKPEQKTPESLEKIKPEFLSQYHDQGKDLADRAEHGHLDEVMKELHAIRDSMKRAPDGKDRFNALMQNIKNTNEDDVRQDVKDSSVKHWFGIGDKKPTLPTLLFEDAEHDGIPNKLYGSILIDAPSKTQQQEAKPEQNQEARPAPKTPDYDNIRIIDPNSAAAGELAWKVMTSKH